MPSPFPGMDPYLEHPALWPDLHQRLITYACDQLQEQVGEHYYVAIGERLYVEHPGREIYPDVSVIERPQSTGSSAPGLSSDPAVVVVLEVIERREVFIEIRDAHHDGGVVTVIEVLSPTNKRTGQGRDLYLQKQSEVLASSSHLVEIDLLRAGEPTVALPSRGQAAKPYRVVVSRKDDRSRRELYAFGLRDRLPRVAIPLQAPDLDAVLDLPGVMSVAYERGAYARRLDYRAEPLPPIPPQDAPWIKDLLHHA